MIMMLGDQDGNSATTDTDPRNQSLTSVMSPVMLDHHCAFLHPWVRISVWSICIRTVKMKEQDAGILRSTLFFISCQESRQEVSRQEGHC